jgi:hypothetical protein
MHLWEEKERQRFLPSFTLGVLIIPIAAAVAAVELCSECNVGLLDRRRDRRRGPEAARPLVLFFYWV